MDVGDNSPKTVTRLLLEWRIGDAHTLKALVTLVYAEAENRLQVQNALMGLIM